MSTEHEEVREGFITTREAADLLHVSVSTIQLWVESGLLRAWRTPGGHRRIALDSVEALRRQQREALSGDATPANGASPPPPVVLVVEDEKYERELYRLRLASLPIRVITASNGFEGLLKIGQYRPALVIVDLVMPGMDGFQMIRSLTNAGQEAAGVTLVVVTGLTPAQIAARGGLPAGVIVYHKPTPLPALQELIRARLADAPVV